ncbi:MAG: UDP-N-acetylmuramate dehydrogenase [Ignavibacteria bacterium]
MNVRKNFNIKEFNTFGIDVNARLFAEAYTVDELILLFKEYGDIPKLILGGGSNVLFTGDFNGLIIRNKINGIEVIEETEEYVLVQAGAGVVWDDLVNFTVEKNYGGIENLTFIPGSAGASPIQNIGAYGVEIKDVFYKLEGFNTGDGSLKTFFKDECRFGYRDSIFKRELKDKFVIASVTYRLSKNPLVNLKYDVLKNEFLNTSSASVTIKDISKAVKRIRQSRLPDPSVLGNAGSFFKNPEITSEHYWFLSTMYNEVPGFEKDNDTVKIPAGWLIQKCGWKGKRIGRAGCYEKQALVLVNYGGASGSDLLGLADQIKLSVKDRFRIELETEVNVI